MLQGVLDALTELRPPFAPYEADIHALVAAQLTASGLAYIHEAKLGPGCRIDFLVGDVGVEVKKGRADPKRWLEQLTRYARCGGLFGIILVTQHTVCMPERVSDVPLRVLSLQRLWGVAL